MPNAPKITKFLDLNTQRPVDLSKINEGNERILEFYKEPLENNTYIPLGVSIMDIDRAVVDIIKNKMEFHTENFKTSVYDFKEQRYDEVIQSWDDKTRDESFNLPFVAITKEYKANKGTNFKKYKIPAEISYTVYRIPKVNDSGKIIDYDVYKVPEPLNVDIKYSLEVISNTQYELNIINERILEYFSSSQLYISPNGHTMGVYLENEDNIDDESKSDIDKRRFFHNIYKLTVKGYIINSNNFIKQNVIKKIDFKFNLNNSECNNYEIIFYKNSENKCKHINFYFNRIFYGPTQIKMKFNKLFENSNYSDLSDFEIKLNNSIVNLPFNVNVGDILSVEYKGSNKKRQVITFF